MTTSAPEDLIPPLEMAFRVSISARDLSLLTATISLGADPFKPYSSNVSLAKSDFSPYSHAVEVEWAEGISAMLCANTSFRHLC